RDMHRQAPGQVGVAALDLDQHADLAAVHVRGDGIGAVDGGDAAHLHVLADLGDHGGAGVLDGFAGGELRGLERFGIGGAGGQRSLHDGFGEALEVVVDGDEIGLGIDFDQDRLAAVLGTDDAAFGGDAAGLLVGL